MTAHVSHCRWLTTRLTFAKCLTNATPITAHVTQGSVFSAVAVGMSAHMCGHRTRIFPAQLLEQLPEEVVRMTPPVHCCLLHY
jgi:hypothetical protein